MKERAGGRLWNTNASGGYLIWRLDPVAHPEWKVFTDGRQPLFVHALGMDTVVDVERELHPQLLVLDYFVPWKGELPHETAIRTRHALVHFSDAGRTYP